MKTPLTAAMRFKQKHWMEQAPRSASHDELTVQTTPTNSPGNKSANQLAFRRASTDAHTCDWCISRRGANLTKN